MNRLAMVNSKKPAGMDAAIAAGEYQAKNIRSMKCCNDQALVLRINGKANLIVSP